MNLKVINRKIFSSTSNDSAVNSFDRQTRAFMGSISVLVRKEAVEYLSKKHGELLDLGCGNGIFFSDLRHEDLTYYGIDRSSGSLENASYLKSKLQLKNIHLLQSDFFNLPFKPDIFDYITLLNTTVNLKNLNEIEHLFKNIFDLMKSSTRLIVDIRNGSNPLIRLKFYFHSIIGRFRTKAYKRDQIETVLTNLGLEIEYTRKLRMPWLPFTVAHILIVKKAASEQNDPISWNSH
jgi:ubiquinone/menaquinone biosynthesis C-methylase UbiE